MPAEVEQTILWTPHCNDCHIAGGPRATEADAEAWVERHNRLEHDGFEEHDG